jgi:hypothetical protein
MRIGHELISTVACFVLGLAVAFAQGNPSPKDGVVPDADTAIKIAVVVWSRMYGEREIAAQKPYSARLNDGIWYIQGPPTGVSVAYAEIAKADGRIVLTGMATRDTPTLTATPTPTAPATNSDFSRQFRYPQATLVIESGSHKQTLSIARNSFIPTALHGSSCVQYAGGIAFDTGAGVTWEFLGKTEHGDVYLFMIQRPGMKGMKKEVTPILFTGVAQELAQFADLRVELLPELPAGAKLSTPCR